MRHSVLQFIEQPALLAEVSLDDLLGELGQYPYSTNLRLLVLLKARQTDHPDFESYLNSFASSTFDRSQLYHLLTALEQQQQDHSGEILELLELDELELAPLEHSFNEELPSRLNELPDPQDDVVRLPPVERKPIAPEPPDEDFHLSTVPPAAARTARWVRLAEAYTGLFPHMFPSSRPEDPSRFTAVQQRQHAPLTLSERLQRLRRRSGARSHVPRENSLGEVAVVSETLAALLVRQEQYHSAIQMYRRLILLYPEKKPIFAGLIQELKEKL